MWTGARRDGTARTTCTGRVVLVEPNLDLENGHWGDSVVRLASAAVRRGDEAVVIGPRPPSAALRRALTELGVSVPDTARAGILARTLGRVGDWLARREATRRERGDDRRAGDLWLLRVLIDEVLSLRAARDAGPADGGVVLLTGSSAYIGLSAALSRCAHVRVVHDVHEPAGRRAARVARLELGATSRVSLVCPTDGVAAAVPGRWRAGGVHVRPFAVRDDRLYVSSKQRACARAQWGFGDDELVVAVVGGWWPAKDVATVLDALTRVGPGVRVLVAGDPIDRGRLGPVARHLGDRLVVIDRPLTRDDLREIYAVADASVVSRHVGVVKESGLVLDSLRYGVHLVISDHASTPRGLDHVSVFRAGDPAELAATIDRLRREGAPRPGPRAAEEFGLLSADEALDAYSSSRPSPAKPFRSRPGPRSVAA